jgi:branched-subunit amino acid aminotransferase/4-amino-4-deoxychorismate lyase
MDDLAADRGFTLGVGLFETVLVRGGEPILWDEHLARLARGCVRLGLPAPEPRRCRAAAREALGSAGLEGSNAALRLTWTGGEGARGLDPPTTITPRLLARASPLMAPPIAISLHVVSIRRNPSSPSSCLKTLSYLDQVTARAEARAAGADDALMLSVDDSVACAAAGNLFWLTDGVLHTPALTSGVLDGIVRGAIIYAARELGDRVVEVRAPLSAVLASNAVFISNSLVGLVQVTQLHDRSWRADPDLTERLRRTLLPLMMR